MIRATVRAVPSAALLVLFIILSPSTTPATAEPAPSSAPTPVIYMCPSDEGESPILPCVYDARHLGNGQGTSFIIRRDGEVVHVTHKRAHRLLTEGR